MSTPTIGKEEYPHDRKGGTVEIRGTPTIGIGINPHIINRD
jgi:hypothetical protein